MKKLTETEVLDIMKQEIGVPELSLDGEGQYDSLDLIAVLTALEVKGDFKIEETEGTRELQTAMTPRKIIDLMKKRGLIGTQE
jgi:acyl carrier protein